MPDERPVDGGAAFLAAWTGLKASEFESCYRTVYPRNAARSWQELVAAAGEEIIAEACLEAAAKGFLNRLAQAVANWELDNERSPEDIKEMLSETGDTGIMQAILNEGRALSDAGILGALLDASHACAIVWAGSKQVGTAFLVRSDLVLTAAHVVMDVDGQAEEPAWVEALRPDLRFSFRARDSRSESERVEIYPAPKDALVDFSPPHGMPPNQLIVSLLPEADGKLDYALIKLAQRVEHVVPVPVDPPAFVEKDELCWAFGYPGGNALKMDMNDVADDRPGGSRWLHGANAAPGMSGGVCMNHLGKLAGIHEGTISTKQGRRTKKWNRGVAIAAIRASQCAGGRDPLAERSAINGLEFDDPLMVAELYRAGLRLGSASSVPLWQAMVNSVFPGTDPENVTKLAGFHPWFPRADFEKWIDSDAPGDRLCFVWGERGAGASFCSQILRSKLHPAGLGYFQLNPTQISSMSTSEAFDTGDLDEPSASRTSAANYRYNNVNQLIAELRRGNIARPRTSCVVMDFGPVGGPDRLLASQWQEFVIALLGQGWIRLVLIGLTSDEQAELIELLKGRTETVDVYVEPIELEPISRKEFKTFARKLGQARGQALLPNDLDERLSRIIGPDTMPLKIEPTLQTAYLALAAITFEAGL